MELLKSLPKILPDETFSSWAFRCVKHRNIISNNSDVLRVEESYNFRTRRFFHEDPDFDSASSFVNLMIDRLGLEASDISSYFSAASEWILPWGQRKYYCPSCLRADIAKGGLPYWRKQWCYVLTTYCSTHRTPLVELSKPINPKKAWSAFVECSNLVYSPRAVVGYSNWMSERLCKARLLMANKVVRWYAQYSARFPKGSRDESDLRKCFEIFFSLLLQLRTRSTREGYARKLFYTRNGNIEHAFDGYPNAYELGVNESNATQRTVALIYCGFIFSLFTDREIVWIKKLHAGFFEDFTASCEFLANHFTPGMDSNYFFLRNKFSGMSLTVLELIRDMLYEIDRTRWESIFYENDPWKDVSNSWKRWHFDAFSEPGIDYF